MNEHLHLSSAGHVVALRGALAQMTAAKTESEAIDRLRALEQLKAACAAAQVRETQALDGLRHDAEAERSVPADKRCKGVAAEVALARRESPVRGARFLSLARALKNDLPRTMAAMTAGTISEEKAHVLDRETSWLSAEKRRQVDEFMADRLDQVGVRRLGSEARAHSQKLDQEAAAEHLARAEEERRVSVRPAPDSMAYLTALLPMPQAVAVYANLHQAAATAIGAGDAGGRGQGQVMADLLVERLTGQESAAAVPIELHVVMSQDTLLEDGADPAWVTGHGPIPAGAARRLLADSAGAAFVRRLFITPESGQLVAMDTRRREFSGLLRRMVVLRDDTCRTPWCDAPIRQVDHATPHRDEGPTNWSNASGLCAACNYVKENPGWRHTASPERLDVTTPTGHAYEAATPPLSGGPLTGRPLAGRPAAGGPAVSVGSRSSPAPSGGPPVRTESTPPAGSRSSPPCTTSRHRTYIQGSPCEKTLRAHLNEFSAA